MSFVYLDRVAVYMYVCVCGHRVISPLTLLLVVVVVVVVVAVVSGWRMCRSRSSIYRRRTRRAMRSGARRMTMELLLLIL